MQEFTDDYLDYMIWASILLPILFVAMLDYELWRPRSEFGKALMVFIILCAGILTIYASARKDRLKDLKYAQDEHLKDSVHQAERAQDREWLERYRKDSAIVKQIITKREIPLVGFCNPTIKAITQIPFANTDSFSVRICFDRYPTYKASFALLTMDENTPHIFKYGFQRMFQDRNFNAFDGYEFRVGRKKEEGQELYFFLIGTFESSDGQKFNHKELLRYDLVGKTAGFLNYDIQLAKETKYRELSPEFDEYLKRMGD